MATKAKAEKEVHWRCKKCGDEIYRNTHKSMTYCKCGALGVDGYEFYVYPVVSGCTTGVRLIGNEADCEEIRKVREK